MMLKEEEKIILNKLLKGGVFNLENKKPQLAIEKFKKILITHPNNSQILNLLCIAYHQLGNFNKALGCINQAIKNDPNEVGFYINLGNIYKDLKSYVASIESYEKALKINNKSVDALYNIGVIYASQHQYFESIVYYKKAIQIDLNHKYSFDNLGNAYMELADFDQAISCYNRAISIDQNFFQAHHNLSFVLLLTNSLKLGWEKYEYRLRKDNYKSNIPFLDYAYWDGSNLKDKNLLIYCEQGIGDNIQFARYIKKIKKNNTKIILYCNKSLLIFFKSIPEVDLFISSEDQLPKIDYYISIMSLPYIFRNDNTIPESYNFFKVDKKNIKDWNLKLKTHKKIKVGLVWQGGKTHDFDYKRSILLKTMKPILELENIQFISLQKDFGSEQIKINTLEEIVLDFSTIIDQTPFEDTLSIIENLDLVIGVDTAVIHIAATLGKKTWIVLPFVPDFRWGLKELKTPWYSSVTLFRQKKVNQWDDVITEIKDKLIRLTQQF